MCSVRMPVRPSVQQRRQRTMLKWVHTSQLDIFFVMYRSFRGKILKRECFGKHALSLSQNIFCDVQQLRVQIWERERVPRSLCVVYSGGSNCQAAWYSATSGSLVCFSGYCGLGSVFDGTNKCLSKYTRVLLLVWLHTFSALYLIHHSSLLQFMLASISIGYYML